MSITTIIYIVAILIICIAFGIYIAWKIKKEGLKQFVVDAIVYAEENITYNEDKFNYVVERVIALIPAPFNLFITTSMVEKLVQDVFDLVKKALDYKEV
jgi:uncharacterized membrane protein YjgN (DUF898 family)